MRRYRARGRKRVKVMARRGKKESGEAKIKCGREEGMRVRRVEERRKGERRGKDSVRERGGNASKESKGDGVR